jgi:DNA adenine methylase
LLDHLTSLSECGASIVISGYASSMYNWHLAGWRRVDFQAMTHRGPRTESLWCNFAEPTDLHDKRFIGKGWRERQRIQRKKARWMARLARLKPLERAALIEAVQSLSSTHAASGVTTGAHVTSGVPRVTTNPA